MGHAGEEFIKKSPDNFYRDLKFVSFYYRKISKRFITTPSLVFTRIK